ncbi:DUF4158 domain-containing protein [Nonomuraea sp. NPDC003709]|uniref:DUF4158 domain-containing protein n=1 Tax=Nonomuraea sp. NPDC003709 TaxID=3154450 RepID=UPI0033AECFB6
MTSIERTPYPRFKRFLSARELHVFHTPQTEEIAWASGQVRSDNHLLALMVQLKCFNRMGYFPGWVTSRRQWWLYRFNTRTCGLSWCFVGSVMRPGGTR